MEPTTAIALILLVLLGLFMGGLAVVITQCYTNLAAAQKEATDRSNIAMLAAIYSAFEVRETKGAVNLLKEAPTLRQYVERYVPVTTSDDARKELAEKMKQYEGDWNSIFGFAANGPIAPEDTV